MAVHDGTPTNNHDRVVFVDLRIVSKHPQRNALRWFLAGMGMALLFIPGGGLPPLRPPAPPPGGSFPPGPPFDGASGACAGGHSIICCHTFVRAAVHIAAVHLTRLLAHLLRRPSACESSRLKSHANHCVALSKQCGSCHNMQVAPNAVTNP